MSMRITSGMVAQNLVTALNSTETQLSNLEAEGSSGLQFQTPENNPQAVAQSLGYSNALALVTQYQSGATAAQTSLNTTSSALQQVQTITQNMQNVAVQGSNSSLTTSDMQSLAQTVNAAISELNGVANTQSQGVYIFGGTNNLTPPWNATTSQWTGNSQATTVQIGPSTTVQTNVDGSSIFPGLISNLQTLANNLNAGNTSAVQNSITALQNDSQSLGATMATVGSNTQLVTNSQSQLQSMSTTLTESLSSTEDVNMAQLTTQITQEEQTYQTAIQSGASILQTLGQII